MNTQAVRNKVDVQQIRLLLVDTCNAKCKGCHNEGQDISGSKMSLEWIKDFMSLISGLNVREVVLSGGEPLLHPQIEEIIKVIRENLNCFISINTNGLIADKLLRVYPLVDEVKLHIESSHKEEYEDLMKLDFDKVQHLVNQLPNYDKLIICCILRNESQALGLIDFAKNYQGAMVKFNELTSGPSYSIKELEEVLLTKENFFVTKRSGSNVKLSNSTGAKVSLRQCVGEPPYIDAKHQLRRGLFGLATDLVPLVTEGKIEELSFLLGSVKEVEYRWCLSQSTFSLLGNYLGLQKQYEYQMDRVYILNGTQKPNEVYFRIKDRGGELSFDIKGRANETEMYREQTISLDSLEDALNYAQANAKPNLSVEKFRASCEANFLGNSKLHLDMVIGLGYFVELEGIDADIIKSKLGLDDKTQALPYGEYIQNGIIPVPIELDITELNLNKGI